MAQMLLMTKAVLCLVCQGPKENSLPETVKNDDVNFSIGSCGKNVARRQLNREERIKMVEKMNEFISSINKGVSFKVDENQAKML